MRLRRIVAPGLAVVVVTGLATWAMNPASAEADKSTMDWKSCPTDVVGAERLECATVDVPLDYDEPDAKTTEVMISRLASSNPEERRGVLLLNPGGPGGSGLSQPTDLVDLGLPDSVADAYDLIGMDPRGVGHSSPVSCGFTADQGYTGNIPPFAPDDEAVTQQAEAAEKIAKQCADNDPEGRMKHMTTANTARDMDFIREALGEDKINFFGASYGSALGAAYASMFPRNSDRFIIDSNLGGTSLDWEAQRRFGPGMEIAFPDYAKWLAERHGSYGLGETAGEVRDNYFALAEQLDAEPVAGTNGAMFRFIVFFALYKERNYGMVANLWQSLATSDEKGVREQTERMPLAVPGPAADQEPGGELSPHDNAWSSYLAVTCNDTEWPEDVGTYREQVAEDRQKYPMYGAAAANLTPCAFWHNDPVDPPVEIDDEGPQNILVMQNERDPATPLAGGQKVREEFGDRARLVTVDAGGHGVYVYGGNACALEIGTAFLLDGELPTSDVSCEASSQSGLDLDDAEQRRRDAALDRLGVW